MQFLIRTRYRTGNRTRKRNDTEAYPETHWYKKHASNSIIETNGLSHKKKQFPFQIQSPQIAKKGALDGSEEPKIV